MEIKRLDKNRAVPVFLWAVAGLSALSLFYLQIPWGRMLSRSFQVFQIFGKLFHFDFSRFDLIGGPLLETISITVLATAYSWILAVIFGMLAAKNLFKVPALSGVIKAFFSFLRAVPTPVWVLLTMICIGMGPAAGITGLCAHTTAFFTRAFAQSFEAVPKETVEALEATGAGKFAVFSNAIFPSALPELIAWTGMRLEINFSESSILGMVGAGGIGYVISANIEGYEYGTAGLAIFCVFLIAFILERAFVFIKRRGREEI